MLRNGLFVLVLAIVSATAAYVATPAAAATARLGSVLAHSGKAARPHGRASAHHTTSARMRAKSKVQSRSKKSKRVARVKTRRTVTRSPRVTPAVLQTSAPEEEASIEKVALRPRRAVLFPAPLRGSFESLSRQNEKTEADGLERILDEDDLNDRIEQKLLVPVPASSALTVNSDLPESHKYCRPWTADFLTVLAHAHYARFHKPLEVSSAVRTVEYQKHLQRTNGNAAAAEGDIVSPHVTGATIDIVKHGMRRQELGWMREWLLEQQLAGNIDVEEEFRQACFHITVYKSFVPPEPANPPSHKRRSHVPAQLTAGTPKPEQQGISE